jgi:hypothetical protein
MKRRLSILLVAVGFTFLIAAAAAVPRALAAFDENCHLLATYLGNNKYTASCMGPCANGYPCERGTTVHGSGVVDYWCHCNGGVTGDCDSILILSGTGEFQGYSCSAEVDCTEECLFNQAILTLQPATSDVVCYCDW